MKRFLIALAFVAAGPGAAQETLSSVAAGLAAWPDQIEALKAMIAEGADPNIEGRLGLTPLYWAAMNQNVEGVGALLDAGANPNWAERNTGWTPLHIAANFRDAEIARLLLDAGANPNAKDGRCLTPLNYVGTGYSSVNREASLLIIGWLEAAGGVLGRLC